MQRTAQQRLLTLAVLPLFALIASACGAVVTASEQRAVENSSVEISVANPAVPPSAPASGNDNGGGHQYGATLEEWAEIEQKQEDKSEPASDQTRSDYPEIAWDDLIPAGASGEELLERFEDRLDAVEPGSDEAEELYAELRAAYNPEAVNPELDGQKIRLAGFVAPLTYDDDIVTEFLLVPTVGACIHVPPPPPNQTIMVSVDKDDGLTLDESWGAVWVEGTMVIESGSSDLGATSYRITEATSGAYSGV